MQTLRDLLWVQVTATSSLWEQKDVLLKLPQPIREALLEVQLVVVRQMVPLPWLYLFVQVCVKSLTYIISCGTQNLLTPGRQHFHIWMLCYSLVVDRPHQLLSDQIHHHRQFPTLHCNKTPDGQSRRQDWWLKKMMSILVSPHHLHVHVYMYLWCFMYCIKEQALTCKTGNSSHFITWAVSNSKTIRSTIVPSGSTIKRTIEVLKPYWRWTWCRIKPSMDWS